MSKEKNFLKRKRKLIIVSVLIAIIAITLSLNLNRTTTKLENLFKSFTIAIDKLLMTPYTKIAEENSFNQDESYIIQKNINSTLEKEISELKDLLDLNKTMTEYTIENATILSRNKSYWFNTLTIDKGKNSGIKNNMAVITSNGLIGKISKTYSNCSEVKLITSDDANYKVSVSIKINDQDNYAILNGYDQDKNLLKVTGVAKTTNIKKGDVVLTSGLGELFPAGIYVGDVEEIKSDKYDLSKTIYIKTKQDFNSIHYVSVLKEKNKWLLS